MLFRHINNLHFADFFQPGKLHCLKFAVCRGHLRENSVTILYFVGRKSMNYAGSFTSYPSLIRVPANINPELIV
jgi:hypothetical protein